MPDPVGVAVSCLIGHHAKTHPPLCPSGKWDLQLPVKDTAVGNGAALGKRRKHLPVPEALEQNDNVLTRRLMEGGWLLLDGVCTLLPRCE